MNTRANISRRDFIRATLAASAGALFGLSGCTSPGGSSASSTASGTAAPYVTVVDCVGRSVDVPVDPERVSMLDSFAGELTVMIGAGPKLVGVPGGVASDVILCGLYPGLSDVSAPMTSGSLNMEEFMAKAPQVAVVKRDLYETDGQAAQLDASNVPYVVVGYENMEQQIAMMRMVGAVCGGEAQTRAEALACLYEDVIAECAQRTGDLAEADKVRVYHAINALTMTDGATSVGADWVQAAGCIDVSAEHPELATTTDYTTTLEQIFDWDPDVFVCNSADTTDYLLTKDNCAGLRAVQAGRCYTIPVGATRWGQRGSVETYLAMLWLGVTVYPERYTDFNLKDYVVTYYRDYLDVEVTDEIYDLMLSGRGLRKASKEATGQK